MNVYKDIFNGDEMASDAFPLAETGPVLEVECKMVTRSLVGALEGDEGSDTDAGEVVTVNNVVDACRLVETSYDKKNYTKHLKAYLKRLTAAKEARGDQDIKEWQAAVSGAAKQIMDSFAEWRFFTGEKMDPECMVALLGHRQDGTPYLRLFKDGLRSEPF